MILFTLLIRVNNISFYIYLFIYVYIKRKQTAKNILIKNFLFVLQKTYNIVLDIDNIKNNIICSCLFKSNKIDIMVDIITEIKNSTKA
jgi:hypothetical protein